MRPCWVCGTCFAKPPRALACLPCCATECCATHSREKNVCAIMFEGFRVVIVLFRHVSSTVPWSGLVHRRGTSARECVFRLLACAKVALACHVFSWLACSLVSSQVAASAGSLIVCMCVGCQHCWPLHCRPLFVPRPLPPYGTIGRGKSCAPMLGLWHMLC